MRTLVPAGLVESWAGRCEAPPYSRNGSPARPLAAPILTVITVEGERATAPPRTGMLPVPVLARIEGDRAAISSPTGASVKNMENTMHEHPSRRSPTSTALLPLLLALSGGCIVQQVCTQDRDCVEGRCDEATGACVASECGTDADCGGFPFTCDDGTCTVDCSEEPISCPDDMAPVCGHYCIDVFEASRQDATEASPGVDDTVAVSQPGVIPWYSSSDMSMQIAATACEAAGKRLCSPQEWQLVCATTEGLGYSYGDDYDPAVCNGIDTYCDCDADGEPDGEDVYPHCRDECSTSFHVMPTGSFPGCTNTFGIFDINGNVWEVVATDDGVNHYRGGAYNCSDSERLHRCDYDGAENGGFPSARGFRCCADPEGGR